MEEFFRTEVIPKTLNPEWKAFKLKMSDLTVSGDPFKSSIQIECYDHEAVGASELIGKFEVRIFQEFSHTGPQTTLDRLFYDPEFELTHGKKHHKIKEGG